MKLRRHREQIAISVAIPKERILVERDRGRRPKFCSPPLQGLPFFRNPFRPITMLRPINLFLFLIFLCAYRPC
jgi:hypothetical protein